MVLIFLYSGLKISLLGGLIISYIYIVCFPFSRYKGIEWILYSLQKTWFSEIFDLISKSQLKAFVTGLKILFWVILHLNVSNFLLSLRLKFWNLCLAVSQCLEFSILYPQILYSNIKS